MTPRFRVDHSILSPEALTTEILPRFGIRDARVVFYQSGFNDTYRVESRDGQVYFLRVYRHGWRTREDALYELDVLEALREKGIRVAFPLASRHGGFLEEVAAPEGTRGVAVFVSAPGQELEYGSDPAPPRASLR